MIGIICNRRHWALTALPALALASMDGRVLTPAGYMFGAQGEGIAVTLCGSGHAAILDLGDEGDAPSPQDRAGRCLFAASAAAAPPSVASAYLR